MSDEELIKIAFAKDKTVADILRHIFNLGVEKGRADADADYNLLLEQLAKMEIEWVCDDIVGEFIDENDEPWCSTHCHSDCGANAECFKKWVEWKREQIKEQKNE